MEVLRVFIMNDKKTLGLKVRMNNTKAKKEGETAIGN